MQFLLDADVIIDFLAEDPTAIPLVRALTQDGLALSVVTYMEVLQGIVSTGDLPSARSKLNTLVQSTVLLDVSFQIATRCAYLRSYLAAAGRRIRPRSLDLLVAATALHHDLTLVSRNTRDYSDIPGLRLLDQPPA